METLFSFYQMIQIAQQLEKKEYNCRSYEHDTAETEFFRRRESDLLFRHGLAYDASSDLDHARAQVNKSLENMQRQMEKEREHVNQRELSL